MPGPAPVSLPHHPHDVIDDVDVTPSFPDDPTVFVHSAGTMSLYLKSPNRGFTWDNAGRGIRGRTVNECEIAADWQVSRTAYAVVEGGGLHRTRDGGETWELLRGIPNLRMLCLGPEQDGRQPLFYGSPQHLWLSEDGGDTSRPIAVAGEATGESFATLAATVFQGYSVLFVGTGDGHVLRRVGDAAWSKTELPAVPKRIAVSPDFGNDLTLWVATHGAGVLVSKNGGATFERSSEGIADADVNFVMPAPSFPECQEVFAATRDDGVYRSPDGGSTWELLPLRVPKTRQTDNHYRRLAISPRYPEDPTLYCGTFEGLYFSFDGGKRWAESNINPTRIGRKLALSPNFADDHTVFAATYGNPFMVSFDRGRSWEVRADRFDAFSSYCIGVSPDYANEPLILVGSTQGLERTVDGGVTWQHQQIEPVHRRLLSPPEMRTILFSPRFAEDRTVLAVSRSGFYVSENGGETWAGKEVPTQWAYHIAVNPQWPGDPLLVLGGMTVHLSDDVGSTWGEPKIEARVVGVRFAPDFAETGEIYVLSQRGFHRSVDRGATWAEDIEAFEGFVPSAIELSPDFERTGETYVATLTGGLFASRDRGLTWARMHELGSALDSCYALALSPGFATDRIMFAGTLEGFLRSEDAGATWELVTRTEFYDDERAPWIQRGGWSSYTGDPGYFCRRILRGWKAGQEMTLPFAGTGVQIYGSRGPNHGFAEVWIDGYRMAQLDLYAPEVETQQQIFAMDHLPFSFHEVTVRVMGESREEATGSFVGVDAAMVSYRPFGPKPASLSADWQQVVLPDEPAGK